MCCACCKTPCATRARLRRERCARGGRRACLHRPHVGRRRAHRPGRAGAGLADHGRGNRPLDRPPLQAPDAGTRPESVQKPLLKMDEGQYYDMLSAFIKSMRGSDPDAALFWFSRLLYAGVDPRLIVRRIVVHAQRGCGPGRSPGHAAGAGRRHGAGICGHARRRASPSRRPSSPSVWRRRATACAWPSTPPWRTPRRADWLPCPRTCATRAMPRPHARTPQYKYPHDYPGHFVKQAYMPPGYEHTVYYRPTGQGHEAKLRDRHARRFGEGHEA